MEVIRLTSYRSTFTIRDKLPLLLRLQGNDGKEWVHGKRSHTGSIPVGPLRRTNYILIDTHVTEERVSQALRPSSV